jgi:hypothetical protein
MLAVGMAATVSALAFGPAAPATAHVPATAHAQAQAKSQGVCAIYSSGVGSVGWTIQ